jgi:putative oxidoreductase
MERTQTAALLALGRLLMALIFIYAGWGKLMAPQATIGYIASVGLPVPPAAYAVSLAVELGGGLLLLAGLFTRWAALALALFCVVTAVAVHGFGDMNNQIHAMKNIAMAGGFLFVVAHGAGAWSLDALRGRRSGGVAHA